MTITGRQVRAARRLLGWTQAKLAGEVGVSASTVTHFENERSRPSVLIASTIQRAIEAAGVEFVEGEPGVTLRKGK